MWQHRDRHRDEQVSPQLPPRSAGRGPVGDRLLELQRTAGNRAVAELVGTATLQREMDDQAALDAVDSLPPIVLKGGLPGSNPLSSPERRTHFLRAGRVKFGSNDATLEHFSGIEKASVPGEVWIHRDGRPRLEAAVAAVGGTVPPAYTSFEFRNPFSAASKYNAGSMHTLGYAVDYDAKNLPRIGWGESAELIRAVTGEVPNLQLGEDRPRRKALAQIGDATAAQEAAAGSGAPGDAPANAPQASAAQPKLLADISSESTRLSGASSSFQHSLGEHTKAFLDLRDRYQKANPAKPEGKAERERCVEDAQALITPWREAVDAAEGSLLADVTTAGFGADVTDKKITDALYVLDAAVGELQSANARVKAATEPTQKGPWASLAKLERLVKLPEQSEQPGWSARVEKALAAAQSRKAKLRELDRAGTRIARLGSLKAKLGDGAFLFGSGKAVANSPAMAQLVERGFFNVDGPDPKVTVETRFLVELARHGFDLGAAWRGETTDSMHVEYIAARP